MSGEHNASLLFDEELGEWIVKCSCGWMTGDEHRAVVALRWASHVADERAS